MGRIRTDLLRLLAMVAIAALGCGGSNHPQFADLPDAVQPADCGGASCQDPGNPSDPGYRDLGLPPADNPVVTDFPIGPDTQQPADPGFDDPHVPDPGPGDDTPGDLSVDAGPTCLSTAQCKLGDLCIDSHCVVGCVSERDCSEGLICDPELGVHGTCVQCILDEDCPDAQKCRDRYCASICATDDDCAANPLLSRCSSKSGLCVECLAEIDCVVGKICVGDVCAVGCRGDRDCPQSLLCDTAAGAHGTCVQCLDSGGCILPRTCSYGSCVIDCAAITCPGATPICVPATGECVECTTKDDCGLGKVCLSRTCVTGCADDSDCTNGWHCKAIGTGTCVACVTDGNCPQGYSCRNDACTNTVPGCTFDSDCKNGQYCHPLLKECLSLPTGWCSQDGQCGILGFGGRCDPLTRTCIDSCTLGLCGLLGSTTTPYCVDGGCYECESNYDCPGTSCSLFDRSCGVCKGDVDCVDPALVRCDLVDGRCYGCLTDNQCGVGRRCKPATRTCLDCLSDTDCTNSAKPTCGKDGTCIALCTNGCATQGEVFCAAGSTDGYLECGDWDNDPCLEIGSNYGSSGYACGVGQVCQIQPDGIHGKCVCGNECSDGQIRCNSGGYPESCQTYSSTGCRYWSAGYCGTRQVCSGGACVCDNACDSFSSPYCGTSGTRTRYECRTDTDGCYYWYAVTCTTGCLFGECF